MKTEKTIYTHNRSARHRSPQGQPARLDPWGLLEEPRMRRNRRSARRHRERRPGERSREAMSKRRGPGHRARRRHRGRRPPRSRQRRGPRQEMRSKRRGPRQEMRKVQHQGCPGDGWRNQVSGRSPARSTRWLQGQWSRARPTDSAP